MSDTVQIADFPPAPPPPPLLYKYISPARVQNVLRDRMVRFTPLVSTNDAFEVRGTFERLAGPRFQAMLNEQMNNATTTEEINRRLGEVLKEKGAGSIPTETAVRLIEQSLGRSLVDVLRDELAKLKSNLLPILNSKENALYMLERLGSELLCFSLSESSDNTLMWAHYASSNTGIVVALRTDSSFFARADKPGKPKLQKVTYFDGMMDEPLENPQAAFLSKTTEWSYEKEWRLYAKADQADRIVGNPSDPIHLFKFPSDAVERVILGERASKETTDQVIDIVRHQYDSVPVFRLRADKMARTYKEEPVTI